MHVRSSTKPIFATIKILQNSKEEAHADLCHAKGKEIESCLNREIDPLFKRLNDRKDPAHLQKSDYEQLCSIAKNMRSIKSFLFDRRNQLNRQTAVIRHKIGTDCGRGGQAWEASILASKGAR